MYKNMKKGFTLAEVLITMGLIGVIAVLTLPTLIHQINRVRFGNNYKKESALLVQAIQRLRADDELQSHNSTEEFVNALKKSAKIVQVCSNDNLNGCFPKKFSVDGEELSIDIFNDSTSLGKNWAENTNVLGFVLLDGTSVLTAYNTSCDAEANPFNCAAFVFDMNSISTRNKFEGNGNSDLATLNATITPPASDPDPDDNGDDDNLGDEGDDGDDDGSGGGGRRRRGGGLLGWLLDLLDSLFN